MLLSFSKTKAPAPYTYTIQQPTNSSQSPPATEETRARSPKHPRSERDKISRSIAADDQQITVMLSGVASSEAPTTRSRSIPTFTTLALSYARPLNTQNFQQKELLLHHSHASREAAKDCSPRRKPWETHARSPELRRSERNESHVRSRQTTKTVMLSAVASSVAPTPRSRSIPTPGTLQTFVNLKTTFLQFARTADIQSSRRRT
jgi:hypothetical protein